MTKFLIAVTWGALAGYALWLATGCASKPAATPEHHPLELMMWLQKHGEENE